MTGGLAGLMGCIFVGPRLGRFDSNGKPVDMPGHSATLVVLGTCLLWFGWYGFNPGSTLNIAMMADSELWYLTSGRAAVTTTLSGAAGVLTALTIGFARHRVGALAGCGVFCGPKAPLCWWRGVWAAWLAVGHPRSSRGLYCLPCHSHPHHPAHARFSGLGPAGRVQWRPGRLCVNHRRRCCAGALGCAHCR